MKEPSRNTPPEKGSRIDLVLFGAIALVTVLAILFGAFNWLTNIALPDLSVWWIGIIVFIILVGIVIGVLSKRKDLKEKVLTTVTTSVALKNILMVLGIILLIIFIINGVLSLFEEKVVVVTPSSEVSHTTTYNRIDRRPKIRANELQTLRAGVEYAWSRTCNTIYYFEPTEMGSTELTYRFDRQPSRFLTGDIVRLETGPTFFAKEGVDPMIDGIYTVTVEKDVSVYIRTETLTH